MADICDAIYEVLEEDNPQSVRHVFYAVTSRHGLVEKTEAGYRTIARKLLDMREDERVPFSWVSDNTRLMRKPDSFGSLEEAVHFTAQTYRRDIWRRAPVYVEVWCESDSVAGVLAEETERYDVPLMASRGFSSVTFLYNAARDIERKDKPAYLYYFGDHDPSGRLIPEVIERKLRAYAPDAEIHFETVAVTPEQIDDMDLPTKPPKRSTHNRDFTGGTVEIEAIPARDLRELVAECIEQHIDQRHVDVLEEAENSERGLIERWAEGLADTA